MPVTLEDVGGRHGQPLRDFLAVGHNDNGSVIGGGGGSGALVPSGGDDSATIIAAAPDVRLGPGAFSTPSGFVMAAKAAIEGRGGANHVYTDAITEITCPSQTAEAVRFNVGPARIEKLGIRNTFAGNASAGAGVRATSGVNGGGSGFRAHDLSIMGFYDGINLAGENFAMSGLTIQDCVRYGIYVPTGGPSVDVADGRITDTFLMSGPVHNGQAGLRWEGGGGIQFKGLKTNALGTPAANFVNAVEIVSAVNSSTGELIFSDSVFDAYTQKGVLIDTTAAGAALSAVGFDGCFVRSSANGQNGYYIRGGGVLSHLNICGGAVDMNSNALSAFDIDGVRNLTITDVDIKDSVPTVPIIIFGTSQGVQNIRIRLGDISPGPTTNLITWPTGPVKIFTGQGGMNYGGGGGMVDLEFSWKHPAFTSNATWTNLWDFNQGSGSPLYVELIVMINSVIGMTGNVIGHYERLISWNGSALIYTTIGTDTQNTTDLNVRFQGTGSTTNIQAKIDPGSTATNLTGASVLRMRQIPTTLNAYS